MRLTDTLSRRQRLVTAFCGPYDVGAVATRIHQSERGIGPGILIFSIHPRFRKERAIAARAVK